jgi:hypothetical protein
MICVVVLRVISAPLQACPAGTDAIYLGKKVEKSLQCKLFILRMHMRHYLLRKIEACNNVDLFGMR